jgi:hypothetical protein
LTQYSTLHEHPVVELAADDRRVGLGAADLGRELLDLVVDDDVRVAGELGGVLLLLGVVQRSRLRRIDDHALLLARHRERRLDDDLLTG